MTAVVDTIGLEHHGISEKALDWLKQTATNVGKRIIIELRAGNAPGARASLQCGDTSLQIYITTEILSSPQRLERTIFHECAHARLIYNHGFAWPKSKKNSAKPGDYLLVSLAISMIDDRAVDNMLMEQGITAFGPEYIDDIAKETREMESMDIFAYAARFFGPRVYVKLPVWRYICAWSALKYLVPDSMQATMLSSYLRALRRYYPKAARESVAIARWMSINNIFEARGRASVLQAIFARWQLATDFSN